MAKRRACCGVSGRSASRPLHAPFGKPASDGGERPVGAVWVPLVRQVCEYRPASRVRNRPQIVYAKQTPQPRLGDARVPAESAVSLEGPALLVGRGGPDEIAPSAGLGPLAVSPVRLSEQPAQLLVMRIRLHESFQAVARLSHVARLQVLLRPRQSIHTRKNGPPEPTESSIRGWCERCAPIAHAAVRRRWQRALRLMVTCRTHGARPRGQLPNQPGVRP